jgi:Helix-turn-helix domain
MATITTLKTIPHTRIENTIIANMADIGVYAYAVYSAIKMHLNQATGACFPSYATIARMTGIHRSTVIECVKKLTALKLVSPMWRYKEDGSHASNQYNFHAPEKSGASKSQGAGTSAPSNQVDKPAQTSQGSRPERPPVVAQDDHPSRPEPPEQSPLLNKKQRTIDEVNLLPTERQKTCPHPPEFIVFLPDTITICHHCFGLLDANLQLVSSQPSDLSADRQDQEEDTAAQAVCAA